jgi:hypothetical protein
MPCLVEVHHSASKKISRLVDLAVLCSTYRQRADFNGHGPRKHGG